MKKGHRRTQSANLAGASYEEPLQVANYQSPPRKHNIINLLEKCQNKTKQKVCQVESLHAPRGQDQKLFNFGKGLLKVTLERKENKQDNLISIPQKSKNHNSRQKKTVEAEPSLRHKPKAHLKSILKFRQNKEPRRNEADFVEGVNKLIRIKLGEGKCRKLSMYEPGKGGKQWKHKKEASSLK